MGDNPRTRDEHIALADSRSTYLQQHTPPRSPSSFNAGANEIEEAELSQLLVHTSESSQHRPQRSSFSSAFESLRRCFPNSKRRKIQLLGLYVGLALMLLAVAGSKKGGELVGKYKDSAVGTEAVGDNKGAKGGLGAEDGYDDVERYLKSGNATDGFRENLREELGYLTTWNSAGMTNVFEGYCNLIYLALITQRIPIIPPLVPSPTHLGFNKPLPMINFGEVFDVPRLRRALHSPVLEWKDVKRGHYGEPWTDSTPPVDGVVEEELGCWSNTQVVRGRGPHRTSLLTFLRLDVAYTPVPLSVAFSGFPDQSSFWGLAYLTFEEGRRHAFSHDKDVVTGPTPHSKQNIAPDENLACFDDLYPVNAVDGFEWERDVSPGWRFVGVHVRWNKWVEEVAIKMLKRALGVPESGEVPPFIALHVRRDDFDSHWCKAHPEGECYPPLTVYRNRVRQVQEALAEKFGPASKLGNVHNVIVTSDEKNATWWGEVRSMGWAYIDHPGERTAELYGKWYPAIIDAVAQSMSIGLVGTQRSTMSRVAALRVRDWNGGVSRMVSWSNGKGE